MRKFPALGSALVLALTGAFVAAPAMAFTHHPSTPQERAQTRELNMQSLQQAKAQAPANQQAMNGAQQQAPMQDQNMNQNQQMNSDQGNDQSAPAAAPAPKTSSDNMKAPAGQAPSAPQQSQQPGGY